MVESCEDGRRSVLNEQVRRTGGQWLKHLFVNEADEQ